MSNQKIDFRSTKLSLGVRNNNPGNIRPNPKYTWEGAVGENKGFVVFENIHYGIRALAIDLINKIDRGLDTVEKIINVYAPPEENNTKAYINSVCKSLITHKDTILHLDLSTIRLLISAILVHENGASAAKITTEHIDAGIALIPKNTLKKLK